MIRILPEILSNQIAAGEVVQRPASVVKELVENSIDAGASRIVVEIEKGGKKLIRVSDDGRGLDRDQALLAIERYATSKIFTKDDLFSISTFGFRGEALPSIASVSRFCLVSRTQGTDTGTQIDISGGKLIQVSDAGAPAGTMVEVKQLFFNTPARRKFLKADTTESGHIADAISGMALGNPSVGFRLIMNKKTVRNFPPGQDLFHRAMLVLGGDVTGNLYALGQDRPTVPVVELGGPEGPGDPDGVYGPGDPDGLTVTGAVANPSVTRSTSNRIYLFANNRLIWDRGLVAAVFRGYRGRIMTGRYPMGVICVTLPYDQVDVNVHPSKREVKFLSPQTVYRAVTSAVAQALETAQQGMETYAASRHVPFGRVSETPVSGEGFRAGASDLLGDAPVEAVLKQPHPIVNKKFENVRSQTVVQPSFQWNAGRPAKDRPAESEPPGVKPVVAPIPRISMPVGADSDTPVILGQVMGTYIVAEKAGRLLLVDQHAAHERVVYETLKKRHLGLPGAGQTLLVPETFELSHREAELLATIREDLARMGLDVEPFGGTTFAVKAVPMLLEEKSVKELVVDIVETLMETRESASTGQWLDACLTTMACHHAIRANKPMNREEMDQLLKDLMACDNPMHCPHGRPTIITFDKRQMEKLFKRVV